MENKKNLLLVGGIIIILIAAIVIIFSIKGEKNNNTNLNNEPVVQNLDNTQIDPEQTAPTPIYTKKVELEVMKPAEMEKMGFEEGVMVQVLERDASGTVLSYRLMQSEDDVMEYFGN